MATELISFRLSGDDLQWLQSQRQEGETLNLTAKRLLLNACRQGVDTCVDSVDTSNDTVDTYSKTVDTSGEDVDTPTTVTRDEFDDAIAQIRRDLSCTLESTQNDWDDRLKKLKA